MKGRTGALLAVKDRRGCKLRQQLLHAAAAVAGWAGGGLQRTARQAINRGLDCYNWTDCFDKAAYKSATWWGDCKAGQEQQLLQAAGGQVDLHTATSTALMCRAAKQLPIYEQQAVER